MPTIKELLRAEQEKSKKEAIKKALESGDDNINIFELIKTKPGYLVVDKKKPYFKPNPFKKFSDDFCKFEARKLIQWCEDPDNYNPIPFIAHFYRIRKLPVQDIQYMIDKSAEFQQAHFYYKKILEYVLVSKGLKNKINPTLTIFTLKNLCHWSDRVEVTEKSGDLMTILNKAAELQHKKIKELKKKQNILSREIGKVIKTEK